jgi:hypothetical protein
MNEPRIPEDPGPNMELLIYGHHRIYIGTGVEDTTIRPCRPSIKQSWLGKLLQEEREAKEKRAANGEIPQGGLPGPAV